jgi:glycosyltransferase involved in cell wall biosynthesis
MSEQLIRAFIVVPAYQEAEGIQGFLAELCDYLETLRRTSEGRDLDWNIVVVNDGSADQTEVMLAEAKRSLRCDHISLDYITLLRNFGHQAALLAGLRIAAARTADFAITLDADGEHPFQIIPELVRHWRAGVSIVHTVRLPDPRLSHLKRVSSRGYYAVLKWLGNLHISAGMADYKLWDGRLLRSVRPYLNTCGSTRAFASWLSPDAPVVPYHQNLVEGRASRYTTVKMVSLALSGIIRYSDFPIRLAFYVGVCALIVGTLMFIQAIVAFFMGTTIPGWTSVVATIIFFGGVQCFLLGVYGEYFLRNLFRSNLPTFVIRGRGPAVEPFATQQASLEDGKSDKP